MTNQQFLDGFYIAYDEAADLSAPGFDPVKLSIIASKVQEDFCVTRYDPKGNRFRDGFEETEKRVEDLGELVRYKTYTSFTPGYFTNSFNVTLPNTLISNGPTDFSDVYWFTIYEDVTSDALDCSIQGNTTVFIKPTIKDMSHAELKVAVSDPFRRPYIKSNKGKVLRTRSQGLIHTLVTDGTFGITEYRLGYVAKPLPIDLTQNMTSPVSLLSDHVHRELLDLTVEFCLKITKQIDQLAAEIQTIKE